MDDINEALLQILNDENPRLDFMENATLEPQLYPYLLNKTFDEARFNWIRNNFCRVNIFFRKATTEFHEQIARYSLADLLASVGGVAGLWVGISCISAADMFIHIWQFLWRLLQVNKVEDSNVMRVKARGCAQSMT